MPELIVITTKVVHLLYLAGVLYCPTTWQSRTKGKASMAEKFKALFGKHPASDHEELVVGSILASPSRHDMESLGPDQCLNDMVIRAKCVEKMKFGDFVTAKERTSRTLDRKRTQPRGNQAVGDQGLGVTRKMVIIAVLSPRLAALDILNLSFTTKEVQLSAYRSLMWNEYLETRLRMKQNDYRTNSGDIGKPKALIVFHRRC